MDNSTHKNYLIIDADRGIGHTLAVNMMRLGHNVHITGKNKNILKTIIRNMKTKKIENRDQKFKYYVCDVFNMKDVKEKADDIVKITYDCVIVNSGDFIPREKGVYYPRGYAKYLAVTKLHDAFVATVLGPFFLIQVILRNRRWLGTLHFVFIVNEKMELLNKHWPEEALSKENQTIEGFEKLFLSEGNTNEEKVYYRSKAALTAIAGYIEGLQYSKDSKQSKAVSAVAVHPGFWEVPSRVSVCSLGFSPCKPVDIKDINKCADFVINEVISDYKIGRSYDDKKVLVNYGKEDWLKSPLNKEQRDGFIKFALSSTAHFLDSEPYDSLDDLAYVYPEGHDKYKA